MVVGIFYLWQIALIIALVVLICLPVFLLLRRKINFLQVNILLGVLSIVLAGFYGSQLVLFLVRLPSTASKTLIQPVIASEVNRPSPGEHPDIYYIILDGYGQADMLNNVYGYDNSAFIKSLEGLGFVVPGASRSNYPYTVLSLNSSLNMQYLDDLSAAVGDSNEWWLAKDTLDHNLVRAFLEQKGYRTVFIASGFDYTDFRDADEFIKPYPLMLNNFDSSFLRFTNLSGLGNMGHLIPYPSYSTYRQIIRAGFDALPPAASEAGPKFVFAHITAPHPPFVFDQAGNPINPNYPFTLSDKMLEIMDIPTYKQSYVSELQYINSETIKTITAILANSPTPPVIILQGDHGPGLFLGKSAADTCMVERFSILNAYYLPGKNSDPVPQTITPVNTFRMIFNDYFSTDFALLPDNIISALTSLWQ